VSKTRKKKLFADEPTWITGTQNPAKDEIIKNLNPQTLEDGITDKSITINLGLQEDEKPVNHNPIKTEISTPVKLENHKPGYTETHIPIKPAISVNVITETHEPVITEISNPVKDEINKKINPDLQESVNTENNNTGKKYNQVEKKTFDLPVSTTKRLKLAAAISGQFERVIVNQAINRYLDEMGMPKDLSFGGDKNEA
jgi:hypothetical protein